LKKPGPSIPKSFFFPLSPDLRIEPVITLTKEKDKEGRRKNMGGIPGSFTASGNPSATFAS
jgi:hypothetical protein